MSIDLYVFNVVKASFDCTHSIKPFKKFYNEH